MAEPISSTIFVNISICGYLQQKQRYQAVKNLPMCENNHKRPNLAGIAVFMVRWGCPEDIGNNFGKIDNYRTSQYITGRCQHGVLAKLIRFWQDCFLCDNL